MKKFSHACVRKVIDNMGSDRVTDESVRQLKEQMDLKLGAILVLQRSIRKAGLGKDISRRNPIGRSSLLAMKTKPVEVMRQEDRLKVSKSVKVCEPLVREENAYVAVEKLDEITNFTSLPAVYRCVDCQEHYTKRQMYSYEECFVCRSIYEPKRTKERYFAGLPVTIDDFVEVQQWIETQKKISNISSNGNIRAIAVRTFSRKGKADLNERLNKADLNEKLSKDGYRAIAMDSKSVKIGDKLVEVKFSGPEPPNATLRKMARNKIALEKRLETVKMPVSRINPVGRKTDSMTDEKYAELQKKYIALQRERSQLGETLRANALDTFARTGRSPYLRSLLLPDEGPVGIPDDVVRLNHLKMETVTYNLTVGDTGSGILFLYPNHPTNLIGYHYIGTPTGYVFDQTLLTAQDLRQSYDFGKRVSQILTIRSSTIPSGVYALNGTMNVVRIEGFISEIPGLSSPTFYDQLLSNSVEPLDKLGNVLVGDGVVVLSLMDSFGVPYTRLGDATPSSAAVGVYSTQPPCIFDRSSDLLYTGVLKYDGPLGAGINTLVADTVINADSNTGFDLSLSTQCGGIVGNVVFNFTLNWFALDPFGSTVLSGVQQQQSSSLNGIVTVNFQNFQSLVGLTAPFAPMAAMRLQVRIQCDAAQPVTFFAWQNIAITVPIGARNGINGPIAVLAYQGVAPGSVLTVSGATNFQLVPNPSLRQNIPVKYTKTDLDDSVWCKTVIGDRDTFHLRSVWTIPDYQAARSMLAELADTTVHDRAAALSTSDVIKFMKQRFAPAFLHGLKAGAGRLFNQGLAASGDVVIPALAASGDAVRARARDGMDVKKLVLPPQTIDYKVKEVTADPLLRAFAADSCLRAFAMDMPRTLPFQRGAIVPRDDRAVAFPVVVMHPDHARPLSAQLYIATNVNIGHFMPQYKAQSGEFFLQGLDDVCRVRLNRNVYLSPIDPTSFSKGKIKVVSGPPVVGRSMEGAVWLVCYGNFQGLLPFAVTGSTDGNVLNENDFYQIKHDFLTPFTIPLAGNVEGADFVVEDLRTVNSAIRPRAAYRAR
jgi:hypothetical protein